MRLIDTHCHLYFRDFRKDLSEVISSARNSGVEKILIPGIDLESSEEAIRLSEKYPQLYAAVGIHPNDTKEWRPEDIIQLSRLAKHEKVVAIGEIGLDYYRDRSPKDKQKQALIAQLHLASGIGKPVIIHNRDASKDILPILCDWQKSLEQENNPLALRPGVFHSFSDTINEARTAFEHKFLISIAGPVTFNKAVELQNLVKQVPLNAIMIETDAPFLTPHPYRGKRNEPSYVRYVAQKISELKNLPLEVVGEETSNNADSLFAWRRSN